MAEGKSKGKQQWWNTFQAAKYPAYVTLVDPPSIDDLDLSKTRCRVNHVLMDDVLDPDGYEESSSREQQQQQQQPLVNLKYTSEKACTVCKKVTACCWGQRGSSSATHCAACAKAVNKAAGVSKAARGARLVDASKKKSWGPSTFDAQEGSFILVLPEDAGNVSNRLVSPPWLARVNSIWFVPAGSDGSAGSSSSSSYLEPKGTQPAVKAWERQQIQQGRLAAQHFQLQVTYFYRWPDFTNSIGSNTPNINKLSQALRTLGIADSHDEVLGLLHKRACGGAPPTHFGMRYVMYSNHETKDPGACGDGGDDEDSDGDSPVPMESVMGTAKVHFLDSKAKLPYIHTPRPDASAAPAANSKHSSSALPPSERRALSTSYWQLVPGFICNMFLLTGQGDAPKLFGLQEWADGTGGASLRKQRWAAKSRRQVQKMLESTEAELAAARAAAWDQQRPQGRMPMLAAAAAAAAAAQDADEEVFEDALSGSEQEGEDDEDLLAGGEEEEGDEEPEQAVAAAAAAAASGHRGSRRGVGPSNKAVWGGRAGAAAAAAAAGRNGSRRRVLMGLSDDEEDQDGDEDGDKQQREGGTEEENGQDSEQEAAETENKEDLDQQGEEEEEQQQAAAAVAGSRQQQRQSAAAAKQAGGASDRRLRQQQQQQQQLPGSPGKHSGHGRQRSLSRRASAPSVPGVRGEKGQSSGGWHKRSSMHDTTTAAAAAGPVRKRQRRKHGKPEGGGSGGSALEAVSE